MFFLSLLLSGASLRGDETCKAPAPPGPALARIVAARVVRLVGKEGPLPLPWAAEGDGEYRGPSAHTPAFPLPSILSDAEVRRLFGFEAGTGPAGERRSGTARMPPVDWCAAGPVFDPKTRRLHVPRSSDPLRFQCRTVHGVVHALQDRICGLRTWCDMKGNDDRLFARWAVVEGTAQFVLARYAARYAHALAVFLAAKGAPAPSLDLLHPGRPVRGVHPAVAEFVSFPCIEGERFVRRVYEHKGWAGVEVLLARPPDSTDAVLHPAKYLEGHDPPRAVVLPDLLPGLPKGWRMKGENTLGALGIRTLARATGDSWRAMAAAEGWEGDRYAVYGDGDGRGAVLYGVFLWDDESAARRCFDALQEGLCFTLEGAVSSPLVRDGWTRRKLTGTSGTALLERRGCAVMLLRGDGSNGPDLVKLVSRARTFHVR